MRHGVKYLPLKSHVRTRTMYRKNERLKDFFLEHIRFLIILQTFIFFVLTFINCNNRLFFVYQFMFSTNELDYWTKYTFFNIVICCNRARCNVITLCNCVIVQAMSIDYVIIRIIGLIQNFPDNTREHLDI